MKQHLNYSHDHSSLNKQSDRQAKIKTDKVDAQVLAHLLRCDYLPEVWQPDPSTQRMRELTGRRAALVHKRTGIRNRTTVC